MLTEHPCNPSKSCDDKAAASLCYKITTTSCSKKFWVHDVVCKSNGALSFAPGPVTDDSGLACCCPAADIAVPSCKTYFTAQQNVQLEKPCQRICDSFSGSAGQGDNGICGLGCIWTSTWKRADVSCAHRGDIITYTVTFTNHSALDLDRVCISDQVPPGITIIPGSIHPVPQPGETLQTGISMGRLAAGETAVLTYRVTVNSDTCGDIINCACAKYCYTDCRGCLQTGVGSCKSCIVKLIPDDMKIAVVKCANKNSVCHHHEEIEYTLVIANPGKVTLTDVVLWDNIPEGLCYKTNSTTKNGNGPTDENPQDGISIGTLCPGETYTATFILYVCSNPCCGCPPAEFVNVACVRGRACETMISSESNPWVVTANNRCICQCVQKCLSICDLNCLRSYSVYHTGAAYYDADLMDIVSAGFGIDVKYIDCDGKMKSKSFEGNVVFHHLPCDFNPNDFTVRFVGFVCTIDCCGNISIKFDAKLCYCAAAKSEA